jgi:predicted ATPase/DNA-binding SARP family transcriptional activator
MGAPQICYGGVPVALDNRKALALLAYLALNGRAHSRDALVALLWPDADATRGRAALRSALWALNRATGGEWLLTSGDAIELRPGYALDVARFRQLLDAPQPMPDQLAEAADLATGAFLEGFGLRDSAAFDEWQLLEAEQLRGLLAVALAQLTLGHAERGARDQALAYGRRWLALDALHEPAHRALMQIYAAAGQHAAALRQYRTCQQALADELGVAPAPETTALFERVRSDHAAAGRSESAAPPQPRTTGGAALPAQATPFIGRERELADIAACLDDPDCRLLTLVGPGGSGKTRLALEAAAAQRERFGQGVYFVALASVAAADVLRATIASAIGVSFYDRQEGPAEVATQLLASLHDRRALLVLDNFEHLVGESGLLAEILAYAPQVKLLITSRERLNLGHEWALPVDGLALPSGDAAFAGSDAALLFEQSARRARGDYQLSAEDAPAVAEICRLVDGMPLGIELAASWMRVLTPAEIAREIARSLDFLAGGRRDAPERHHSVRAVFNHSWALLSDAERPVLRRLAVFRGGFRREAAEQIVTELALDHALAPHAGRSGGVRVFKIHFSLLRSLASLADKSLLRHVPDGRYELHELIRQYADEQLAQLPAEQAAVRARHSEYYIDFVAQREDALRSGTQRAVFEELAEEIENIRAAWEWAAAQGDAGALRRALEGLFVFYDLRGWFREGAEDFAAAAQQIEGAGDASLLGRLLARQGSFAVALGDIARGEQLLQRGLGLLHAEGEPDETAVALHGLGIAAMKRGDLATARRLLGEGLSTFEVCGNRGGVARSLDRLANLAFKAGDMDEALRLYGESLALRRALGVPFGIAAALDNMGFILRKRGQFQQARANYLEALRVATDSAAPTIALDVLVELAALHVDTGELQRALELLGAFGGNLTAWRNTQNDAARLLDQLRKALPPQVFAAALARGEAQPWQELARAILAEPAETPPEALAPTGT